nr:MAG TPA: distal tail protein [Caudoviricetes sp.]
MKTDEFYIKHEDGPEISLSDITPHLYLLKVEDNPSIANVYQNNVMQDGETWNYTTYQPTTVSCTFALWFSTWQDYLLAKHDIMKTFMQKGLLRIRTDLDSHIVRYVRTVPFTISPNEDGAHWANFTVSFENPSGMKYSLLRSNQINQDSSWGYGQNLETKGLQYHFSNQTNIQVFNASDIAVDPYLQKHDLKITIKNVSGNLTIQNKTNNSSWQYKENLVANDVILIDGIYTYKNSNYDSMNTDYGYLKLNKGYNEIILSQEADIEFSFPFIYLF